MTIPARLANFLTTLSERRLHPMIYEKIIEAVSGLLLQNFNEWNAYRLMKALAAVKEGRALLFKILAVKFTELKKNVAEVGAQTVANLAKMTVVI